MKPVVLFIREDGAWDLGGFDGDAFDARRFEDDPERATALAAFLRERRVDDLVAALPSSWCLSASMSREGLPRRASHQALTYRLEERLPVAAEELACDFIAADEARALGVGVPIDRVRPLLQTLADAGVRVRAICPAALLSLQALSNDTLESDRGAVLLGDNGHWDLFVTEGGKPLSWSLLPKRVDDLRRCLELERAGAAHALPLHAVGVDEDLQDRLKEIDSIAADAPDNVETDRSAQQAAARSAGRILEGTVTPWLNLRRGALADDDALRTLRGPLVLAAVGAALLLLSVVGVCLYRASQYRNLAQAQYAGALTAYKATAEVHRAGMPIPGTIAALRSRLERKAKEISALRGETDDAPQQASALRRLHEILAPLPVNLRYRILSLRIDRDAILLEGQGRQHGDADKIAQALRDAGAFRVDPPATQKLKDQGVEFVIRAVPMAREGRP